MLFYILLLSFEQLVYDNCYYSMYHLMTLIMHLRDESLLVLATVPNPRFSSGSGLEPNWNHCNGFYPIEKRDCTQPAIFCLVPQFRQLTTFFPMFRVCKNDALPYVEPSQKTTGLCPVRVTTPPRQSSSGLWTGLEPNQTVFPVQTRTTWGIPRPIANTIHYANTLDDVVESQYCRVYHRSTM